MSAIVRLNHDLTEYCAALGRGSLNYTVSVALFEAPGAGGRGADVILRAALGSGAELGDFRACDAAKVVAMVTDAFRYTGDDDSHPSRDFVGSQRGVQALESIQRDLLDLMAGADSIGEITIRNGHPFYPVFWDYAFVIAHREDASVLVGSSSD